MAPVWHTKVMRVSEFKREVRTHVFHKTRGSPSKKYTQQYKRLEDEAKKYTQQYKRLEDEVWCLLQMSKSDVDYYAQNQYDFLQHLKPIFEQYPDDIRLAHTKLLRASSLRSMVTHHKVSIRLANVGHKIWEHHLADLSLVVSSFL